MVVRTNKLGRQVVRLVGGDIIRAEGDPEFIVPSETEIGLQYGVSRTVAREVIQELERLGLIEVAHGRRSFVRPPTDWNYLDPALLEMTADDDLLTQQTIRELHEARMLIEPYVAGRAAQRADDDLLDKLQTEVSAMAHLEHDSDAYAGHDVQFHLAIAEAAGNRVLCSVLRDTRHLLERSLQVTNQIPHGLEVGTQAHARILGAIAARDPVLARQVMRDHLAWTTQLWSSDTSEQNELFLGGATAT
jgi:DNA-binding FadR family transcriptional regulator